MKKLINKKTIITLICLICIVGIYFFVNDLLNKKFIGDEAALKGQYDTIIKYIDSVYLALIA